MQIRTAEERDYENIKALYEEAFPKEERKEFALIVRKHPNVRLEVMEEDNQFCGFLTYILYRDIVFGDYLAVTDNMRGKNVGTQVLTWMKEKYPVEETDDRDEAMAMQQETRRRYPPRKNWLGDMIEVLLYQEMFRRRCRRRNCRRRYW